MRKRSYELMRQFPTHFIIGVAEPDHPYEDALIKTIKAARSIGDALNGQQDILLRPYLRELYLLAKQLLDYQESNQGGDYSEIINELAKNDGFKPDNI